MENSSQHAGSNWKMRLCSGRAWRLQSWSCCALQNQAVVCFLCRGLTGDNTGHRKGRSTSHRGLGGTLKKNMKESKNMAPEVALPCPRGSRWENVKVPVWKLNSWPAGYYQLLLNIETSREEEEDYVRWWGRERWKGIWPTWPAGPVSLASSTLAVGAPSDWTFRPRSYVDVDLVKAISQSILKNVWMNVRIVVKLINI